MTNKEIIKDFIELNREQKVSDCVKDINTLLKIQRKIVKEKIIEKIEKCNLSIIGNRGKIEIINLIKNDEPSDIDDKNSYLTSYEDQVNNAS